MIDRITAFWFGFVFARSFEHTRATPPITNRRSIWDLSVFNANMVELNKQMNEKNAQEHARMF